MLEDEEEIAEILALVLRSAGYTVDIAGTVALARQRLDVREYTLVNTDLRLPDGDGLEIVAIYFLDPVSAGGLVARWCEGDKVEIAGGAFRVREGHAGAADRHGTTRNAIAA